MGQYIDRGNIGFREARKGEYVDKSGLIAIINKTLCSEFKYSCVSRARRFGKSMAAKMLCAYYDRSCDSRELFADLEIANDDSFEEHLNKYPVIYLDLTAFATRFKKPNLVSLIDTELKRDIHEVYPDVPIPRGADLMDYLIRINIKKGDRFFFIIDEWDTICREYAKSSVMDEYVTWLRRMFKEVNAVDVFVGVYMTGILPIKKYQTQSALNNFTEFSMVKPGRLAKFYGFTKEEVKSLSARHDMDFDELEKWYDGYQIGAQPSMFNPNSVIEALMRRRCRCYWTKTGAFDSVATYIKMDYEGLHDDVVRMLAGERVKVNSTTFQNDMKAVNSRDDVLTLLIHLGYLSYDWDREVCYLPNREVAMEMENAIKANNWKPVIDALEQSERLLDALLRGNAEAVASGVEAVHRQEVSLFKYNDENSMACVISLAFYAARNDFHVHRERRVGEQSSGMYQTGDGYADLVLIPRKNGRSSESHPSLLEDGRVATDVDKVNVTKPAVLIELKYNYTTDTAISQIHKKHYPEKIQEYTGDILLVGISYDQDTNQHECHIEQYVKK